MKKFLLAFLFFLLIPNKQVLSADVYSVFWSRDGNTAYNSCMVILSFICSLEQNVKSDVATATVNQFLIVYDKDNKLIKKFKVKRIEYKNGRCWVTPQPIRRYTDYFTTNKCEVR